MTLLRNHFVFHRSSRAPSDYWCGRAGGEERYPAVAADFSPAALTDTVAGLAGDFDGPAAADARAIQDRELAVLFAHCAGD